MPPTTEPGRDALRVRWGAVGAVALVVGTISAIGLRWAQTRDVLLAPLPVLLAVLLVAIAAAVLVLGLRVRRWVRRGEGLDPLGAARTLVLGQTAALGGAAVGGHALARLGLALAFDAPDDQAQAAAAGLCLGAAVVMVVAGMVTQWCCVVPDDDEPPTPPGPRDAVRG